MLEQIVNNALMLLIGQRAQSKTRQIPQRKIVEAPHRLRRYYFHSNSAKTVEKFLENKSWKQINEK